MGLDNPIHIAFIVIILLLVFGAKRLPEIGRSLGVGMREFKDSISGDTGNKAPAQPTITQAPVVQPPTAQAQASQQQAAEAFGATPPEQPVPVEPSRQA
jgi:sec-independent protein translocase protein TatA